MRSRLETAMLRRWSGPRTTGTSGTRESAMENEASPRLQQHQRDCAEAWQLLSIVARVIHDKRYIHSTTREGIQIYIFTHWTKILRSHVYLLTLKLPGTFTSYGLNRLLSLRYVKVLHTANPISKSGQGTICRISYTYDFHLYLEWNFQTVSNLLNHADLLLVCKIIFWLTQRNESRLRMVREPEGEEERKRKASHFSMRDTRGEMYSSFR